MEDYNRGLFLRPLGLLEWWKLVSDEGNDECNEE